jgi:hypothetical protein
MNYIWRFYTDESQHWKWQQLSASKEVISESAEGYKNYEACLVDAKNKGHVFQPSQVKRVSTAPNRSR